MCKDKYIFAISKNRVLISHWEIYNLTGLIGVKHLCKLKCHFSLCMEEHFATKQYYHL